MGTNFEFIAHLAHFLKRYLFCIEAEQLLKDLPGFSAVSSRKALELLVRSFYVAKYGYCDSQASLFELVQDTRFTDYTEEVLLTPIHYIRTIGNRGAHGDKVTVKEAEYCLKALHTATGEFLMLMGVITEYPAFDASIYKTSPKQPHAIPNDEPVQVDEGVKDYHDNIHDNIKAKNPLSMSEGETRRLYINLALKEAGWELCERKGEIIASKACIEIEVKGMPSESGIGYADYVLFDDDGKPLAVIEAKKTSMDPIVGSKQAKLYADCLEDRYGIRPVIFYTNGYEFNVIDGVGGPARKVFGFYSKDELHSILVRRGSTLIRDMAVNREISDRYFIQNAATAVCESLNKFRRKCLVVMATGTGKTRCAISIVDILQRANTVKKVLFLADRTALVKQAKDAFVKFLPGSTITVLNDKTQTFDPNAKVTFSTYQTLINMIDCEDRKFGIAAFDLIVVDECHRSIYNKYRAIFHYFDALILGLTATPREQVDASTYDAFELPDGEPTFSYDLETAVQEGYLVNFHPFERTTKLLKNGLKYADLSENEKKEYEAAFGLIGDIPEEISNKLFYEQIINTDTIDLVWNCLMTEGLRVDSGERLGKSVVFAVNHRHALAIVEEFKKLYPELGDDYCQLIDNQVKYADDIIEKFKVPDGNPIIAVSVDMLDTGIDVPEILNLVFFKRVYSRIKFWQMLGRGTRTCRNLNVVSPRKNFFAGAGTETVVDENGVDNCTDKQGFYVFDFCDVFEFFGAHPDGKTAKSVKSISQKIFDCKTEIVKELQGFEHQENEDHKKYYLQYRDELHTKVKNLNRHLVNVRSALKMVDKYSFGESWQILSALGVKEIQTFISPLMDTDRADEMTAAFDLWLFNMELTEIIGEKDYTKAIDSVVAICNLLLQKLTVPAVAARKEHLIEFVKAKYWVNRTIDKLECVRIQVRDLLKYLDRCPVLNLVTGFEDTLIEKQGGHIPVTPDFRNYKQKVLDYLIEHSDSPVLEKIKTLQPITVEEVKELEDILFNKLGTRDDFNRYAKDMSVGAFIRQLIGLDNETINKLLFEWENKYQFNSAQQEFIWEIIDFVRQNGDIELSDLMNRDPFKHVNFSQCFEGKVSDFLKIVTVFHTVITPQVA